METPADGRTKVDDEPDALELIATILQRQGASVELAASVPALALTAYAGAHDARRAELAGDQRS